MAKVADFGLAKVLDLTTTHATTCGTPIYLAPEAGQGKYTVAVDSWSVGITVYVTYVPAENAVPLADVETSHSG